MIRGFSADPGWNFEGGLIIYVHVLLTFSVIINCMCSTSGVNWVSGRALVFILVCGGVLGFSNLSKLLVWGYAW